MNDIPSFAIFDTAIGTCGIAWGAQGLVGLQLPEPSAQHMRVRLRRRFPDASEPPAPFPLPVQAAIEAIVRLLQGSPTDLESIELDMHRVPEFHQRVYAVARTIPPGSTLSYGEIAARLGEPAWPAARAVGHALGKNPFPIVVPCHRVVAAGGKLGGFSARGGLNTKRQLLAIEIAASHGANKPVDPSTPRQPAAAFSLPLFGGLH